jgi:hypothetical protein
MICIHCSAKIDFRYVASVNQELLDHKECFTCNHFMQRTRMLPNDRHIVINNEMYWIGDETSSSSLLRGYGGRRFLIIRDNERIVTTNLWHNGTVPEHLRQYLPNNAVFGT